MAVVWEASAPGIPSHPIPRRPCRAALNYCSSIRSIQKHVYTIDWVLGCDAPAVPYYTNLVAIKMTGPSSNFLDFLGFLKLTRPV